MLRGDFQGWFFEAQCVKLPKHVEKFLCLLEGFLKTDRVAGPFETFLQQGREELLLGFAEFPKNTWTPKGIGWGQRTQLRG